MKKIIFTLSLAFILVMTSVTAFADDGAAIITIDSNKVEYSEGTGVPFVDENARTQVPFRATLTKFGAEVTWNDSLKVATAVKDDITVEIPIGSNYIIKNGEKITNDTSSLIKDGKTYLPIRKVMEAFGCSVEWDQELKTVVITSEPVDAKAIIDTANEKSYDWKNYDAKVVVDMSMPLPDETGNTQNMNMKMNMNMNVFTEPMKIKMTADIAADYLGQAINQSIMDMYMSFDDKSYTSYIGTKDENGAVSWVKSTVDDESLAQLMDLSKNKENKELMKEYIKDVKYFGKYTENEKTLLRIQYSISSDLFKELLGDYTKTLSESSKEEDVQSASILNSLINNGLDGMTFIAYVDEETGEMTKYEMNLTPLISSIMEGLSDTLGTSPEDMQIVKSLNAKMTMEILNINEAEDFEIPEEALNAPEASEVNNISDDAEDTTEEPENTNESKPE